MNPRKIRSRSVLSLILASVVAACSTGQPDFPPALDESSELILPETIADHMRQLADDTNEGREAGTRGYLLAAQYVGEAFERAGLEPAGDDDGFYQRVALGSTRVVAEQSSLTLLLGERRQSLELDVDFVVRGDASRERAELQAPLAFVGYGVSAADRGYEDYAGIDVAGKVVVLFGGAPPLLPADERAYHASSSLKRRLAVERGAVGMIVMLTPQKRERSPWDRTVRHSKMASMRWLDSAGKPNDSPPELMLQAALSPGGEQKLFDGAEHSFDTCLRSLEEEGRPLSFDLPWSIEARTVSRHARLESPNVAGLLRGSDPVLRDEFVVFTAHLDHLGVGEAVEGDPIHNGAYDNASGVAVLIEVARALAGLAEPPRRSVLFLAVTGEEKGLLGSDYFVEHPTVDLSGIVAAINLDMVMMLHPLLDVVAFGAEHSTLGDPVEQAARHFGIRLSPDPIPEEVLFIRSDQYPFVRRGIPALFVVSGIDTGDGDRDGLEELLGWMRSTYHSPSDDMTQTMDFEAGADFARVNLLIGWLVAQAEERPSWIPGDFFGERFGADAAN